MANRSKRHTHKYHRVDTSFGKVWACALPDCNHYMPQHMDKMVAGKNSLCWTCDETFILTPMNMRESQPTCDSCSGLNEISQELQKRISN